MAGQHVPGPEITFVACAACGNVTLQLLLDERTFRTWEEAARVCQEDGFHFVLPSLTGEDVEKTLRLIRESEDKRRRWRGTATGTDKE